MLLQNIIMSTNNIRYNVMRYSNVYYMQILLYYVALQNNKKLCYDNCYDFRK